MRTRRHLLIVMFCLVLSTDAFAEAFSIKPDGSLVANTVFTTQGVFTCVQGVPCSGSGTSTVMLGSGASAATISFLGVNTAAEVGISAVPLSLGTFSADAPPGFTFPAQGNREVPVLRFTLTLDQSSPVAATRDFFWWFGPGGGSAIPLLLGPEHVGFALGPNPTGLRYDNIIYSVSPFPFSVGASGVTPVTAQVGLAPDPATILLVGTGLAGAAYGRRRRRPDTAGRL